MCEPFECKRPELLSLTRMSQYAVESHGTRVGASTKTHPETGCSIRHHMEGCSEVTGCRPSFTRESARNERLQLRQDDTPLKDQPSPKGYGWTRCPDGN